MADTPLSESNSKKTPSKKSSDQYLEITLPKLRFKDTPLAPLWVFLLLFFAFLLGMMTSKVQYLEKQKTETTNSQGVNAQVNQQAPQPRFTNDNIKSWAKELSLDTKKFNTCFDSTKYDEIIQKDMDAGITAGAEATPSFFINGVKIVGAQPYTIFKDALDKELAGTVTDERVDVEVGHFPVMGNANAAIKIVEFSDFECPFCRRFFDDTLPLIKKNYIDTGKAALYYRHEPLSIHPMAKPFAKAAECAQEQNKFWEMHDLIFKKQS